MYCTVAEVGQPSVSVLKKIKNNEVSPGIVDGGTGLGNMHGVT